MDTKSRSFNAFRNIAFGYAQQLFLILLAFVTKTIFIKKLGVQYAGVRGLFGSVLSLLSLTELGTTSVFDFQLYSAIKNKDYEKLGQLSYYHKKVSYTIAFVIMVIGLLFTPFIKYIVESEIALNELILFYILYLFNTAITYLISYKLSILRADQKMFVYNISFSITQALQYLIQTIYLLITGNFLGFLIIEVFCTLINVVIISFFVKKHYSFLSIKNDKGINKNEIWTRTGANFVNNSCDMIVASTDNILITTLIGISQEGIYTYYDSLLSNIGSFISTLMTGVFGSVGNVSAENNKELSYDIFIKSSYIFNLITSFCTVCYITNIQSFIPIWIGEENLLSIDIVIAMCLSFFVKHGFDSLTIFCNTNDFFKEQMPAFIASVILNIVLSIVLFEYIGMAGIILATAVSKLITIVPMRIKLLYSKLFNLKLRKYVIYQARLLFVNVICLLITIYINSFIGVSLMCIFIRIIICIFVFIFVHSVFMKNDCGYQWLLQTLKIILKINKM